MDSVRKAYPVGDLDGDHHLDTARVLSLQRIDADSTIFSECLNPACALGISFDERIAPVTIDQSLALEVCPIDDVNADSKPDLLIFSRWHEGNWQYLEVWSYGGDKWKQLARAKAFLADDADWKGRILRTSKGNFLIGDLWDEGRGGLVVRANAVRIRR